MNQTVCKSVPIQDNIIQVPIDAKRSIDERNSLNVFSKSSKMKSSGSNLKKKGTIQSDEVRKLQQQKL